ncbi:phage major capsid protein [Bacillus sp. ILBB4]|nr:phage major capsid protein [Bacillus sp. ILBB4]
MELTSNYLQIQKDRKKHPWLKDFLNNLDTVRYIREMDEKIDAISPMRKVIRAIPRQSGKTFLHLSRSEREWLSNTEWHRAETSPVQINRTGIRMNISEDLMSDAPDITGEMIRYYSRQLAERFQRNLENELFSGSPPSDNIRGIGSRAIVQDDPVFFANQYMGEWVGDRHGNVPPIPYDPGE